MISRDHWREFWSGRLGRTILFCTGIVLLIITPIIGALPGPGGIFVFAAGMALTLKNSEWAKRRYVRFKRWQPWAGAWIDRGLRRRSFKRREERRKKQAKSGNANPIEQGDLGTPEGHVR